MVSSSKLSKMICRTSGGRLLILVADCIRAPRVGRQRDEQSAGRIRGSGEALREKL